MIDNVNKKRERPYFLGVVGAETFVVGACRFSHVFFWGEESIGDVFVRSGYNVELYRSFIDICWVWSLPRNCDHQDDITFCPR